MSVLAAASAGVRENVEFFRRFTAVESPCEVALRCWDGTEVPAEVDEPVATLVINHPGALRLMTWPFNNVSFAEAYMFDDVDVTGDLEAFSHYLIRVREKWLAKPWGEKIAMLRRIMALPKQANPRGDYRAKMQGAQRTKGRDKQAVEFHYDGPPSEFYALWLDPRMLYSCAYYDSLDEGLDAAQERKLEHVCRKLQLKPGERFLDVGCGWGGLIVHAAKYHGVDATGVSISREQIKWCERLIAREGLGDRCRVVYSDYRDLPETPHFDKAATVGVVEHFGPAVPNLLNKIYRMLRPGGLYFQHNITRRPFSKYPSWRAFALKYIWPDIELLPIDYYCTELARAGLEIRDVESLREHYIHTLREWTRRLELKHEESLQYVDEVRYRIYRLYLAGGALGFRSGLYNLHQVLTVKSEDRESGLPLTRKAWYEPFEPHRA